MMPEPIRDDPREERIVRAGEVMRELQTPAGVLRRIGLPTERSEKRAWHGFAG